jgi:RimJ/RimL family protein N-acetyltransferase
MDGASLDPYSHAMEPIKTERLELIPATATLVQAEIEDLDDFFEQLGVTPADNWPSENLKDVLPLFLDGLRDPANVGWLSWYWIDRNERALVGGGGFKGRPSEHGTAEIGYETRPAYRRRGYASESVAALVAWALARPEVHRVVAETHRDNIGSIGVLRSTGFCPIGPGTEENLLRFERA